MNDRVAGISTDAGIAEYSISDDGDIVVLDFGTGAAAAVDIIGICSDAATSDTQAISGILSDTSFGIILVDITGISSDAATSDLQSISGHLFDATILGVEPPPIIIEPPPVGPVEVGELRFGVKAYIPNRW